MAMTPMQRKHGRISAGFVVDSNIGGSPEGGEIRVGTRIKARVLGFYISSVRRKVLLNVL